MQSIQQQIEYNVRTEKIPFETIIKENEDFEMEVGEVSDRSDGKLVHLDGLNFSRAWIFSGLANQYPEKFGHLRALANEHVAYSFPNVSGDGYEGGHWLGTFAIYALQESGKQPVK